MKQKKFSIKYELPYAYSDKEIELISEFDMLSMARSMSMVPLLMYREMAIVCFMSADSISQNLKDSVRNCLNEFNKPDSEIKRLSPEWDNLITI